MATALDQIIERQHGVSLPGPVTSGPAPTRSERYALDHPDGFDYLSRTVCEIPEVAVFRAAERAGLQAALACPRRRLGERLEVGGLRLDRRSRTVSYRDRPVLLSELEFGLLARLAREPRAVVRREELWREVWGCEVGPRSRTIDAHAARLRRKLSSAGAEGLVAARRGVGYSLIAPHAVAA